MYTGAHPPVPLSTEMPRWAGELPMGDPIRVIGTKQWDNKMDRMSRVNFLKIYTVEHNVKVDDFGYVDKGDEWKLITQFNYHWGIPGPGPLPPATRAPYPPRTDSTTVPQYGQGQWNTYQTSNNYGQSVPASWNTTGYAQPNGYNQMSSIQENTGQQTPVPGRSGYGYPSTTSSYTAGSAVSSGLQRTSSTQSYGSYGTTSGYQYQSSDSSGHYGYRESRDRRGISSGEQPSADDSLDLSRPSFQRGSSYGSHGSNTSYGGQSNYPGYQ
jgi:hypothetical protein